MDRNEVIQNSWVLQMNTQVINLQSLKKYVPRIAPAHKSKLEIKFQVRRKKERINLQIKNITWSEIINFRWKWSSHHKKNC